MHNPGNWRSGEDGCCSKKLKQVWDQRNCENWKGYELPWKNACTLLLFSLLWHFKRPVKTLFRVSNFSKGMGWNNLILLVMMRERERERERGRNIQLLTYAPVILSRLLWEGKSWVLLLHFGDFQQLHIQILMKRLLLTVSLGQDIDHFSVKLIP